MNRAFIAASACIPYALVQIRTRRETIMTTRRLFLAGLIATSFIAPATAQETPSAKQILRQLEAAPKQEVAPEDRVTIQQLKRRSSMRRIAPSIDIRGINFAFGSAEIPRSERWKVENIGDAINQLLDNNPDAIVLIEGHTDAVGSRANNQRLSEARAASLKRDLRRYFGVPSYNLETVGYGEDFLIVPTPYEEWRNRRVTLREVSDLIRR
jgi:outer membrane protein OmpA-like peptidoglycan-associated protein